MIRYWKGIWVVKDLQTSNIIDVLPIYNLKMKPEMQIIDLQTFMRNHEVYVSNYDYVLQEKFSVNELTGKNIIDVLIRCEK